MGNSKNIKMESSQGKIPKTLPNDPTCLVTWTTKSGTKLFVIFNKAKKIHNVYRKVNSEYQKVYSTKDYYTIEKEIERLENNEN